MARPREFDTNIVLNKLVDVFWTKGFDQTSFCDLERATGLKKGSLFAAFGDKEEIFCRALERYYEERCKELATLECTETSPQELIRRWLNQVFERATCNRVRRGCFLVNTFIGMGPKNRRCRNLVAAHRERVEGVLAKLLQRGVETSEFAPTLDVSAAARFLLCVVTGVHALSRSLDSDREMQESTRQIIDLALRSLR